MPSRGLVKHAHDGVVVPTEEHSAELEAMEERQQTRDLEALVSRHAILAMALLAVLNLSSRHVHGMWRMRDPDLDSGSHPHPHLSPSRL